MALSPTKKGVEKEIEITFRWRFTQDKLPPLELDMLEQCLGLAKRMKQVNRLSVVEGAHNSPLPSRILDAEAS